MAESKTDVLILMLMGIIILLMVAIVGLFIRMNQLQSQVLAALGSLQAMRVSEGLGGCLKNKQAITSHGAEVDFAPSFGVVIINPRTPNPSKVW